MDSLIHKQKGLAMQRIVFFSICWFLYLVFTSPANADQASIDWPTFQGNNARTGVSDYPPIKQPKIAWSTRIGIMGYLNNPVIDGDRVFVGSSGSRHNKSDDLDGVYCLDLKTGDKLWHHQTSTDACGVAIDDRFVYCGDDGGLFQAIERKTGKPVWKMDLDGSVFSQPLLVEGVVVVGDQQGSIFAFDRTTGEILWIVDGPDAIRGGLSSDGTNLYAVYTTGRVACISIKGKVLWSSEGLKPVPVATKAYPAPTLYGQDLYFGFARNSIYDAPALGCYETAGKRRWINKNNQIDLQQPDDGRRYFGSIRSSPAINEQWLIYAEPYGNELVWVERKNGDFAYALELGAKMFPHWPSPVIARKQLYIPRHDGGLYAVDLVNRERAWMIYLGDHDLAGRQTLPDGIIGPGLLDTVSNPGVGKPIYATPAIAKDGTLVIGTGEGWLYCIRETE